MDENRDRSTMPPGALLACGVLAVAVASKLNLIAQLWSWSVLARLYGSYYADNNRWALEVGSALVTVSVYLLLAVPTFIVYRRKPATIRNRTLLVLTVGYIAFWILLAIGFFAQMARTGRWL